MLLAESTRLLSLLLSPSLRVTLREGQTKHSLHCERTCVHSQRKAWSFPEFKSSRNTDINQWQRTSRIQTRQNWPTEHQELLYLATFFLNLRYMETLFMSWYFLSHLRSRTVALQCQFETKLLSFNSITTVNKMNRSSRHADMVSHDRLRTASTQTTTHNREDWSCHSGFSVLCSSSLCMLSSDQSQTIAVQPENLLNLAGRLLHRPTGLETEVSTLMPSSHRIYETSLPAGDRLLKSSIGKSQVVVADLLVRRHRRLFVLHERAEVFA